MSLMPTMAMAESLTMPQPFELEGIPLVQFSDMEYPSDDHSAQLTNVDMFEMGGVPVIVAPPSAGESPVLYKLDPTTLKVTAQYTLGVPSGYDRYGKTILDDAGNIYTMVGYNNTEEDPDKVVLKIFQISPITFQRAGTAEIKAGFANMTDEQRMQQSISKPFVGGNGTMEYLNGKIYINIGKEGFKDNSGVVHQANMNYTVDCATMVANFGIDGKFNYVSHSLNQKMLIDGDKVVTVDHGDALPSRSLLLTVFNGGTPLTKNIMDMPLGGFGDNNTGLAITGLAATDSHYWITGTSCENWDNSVLYPGNIRNKNIFLIKVDKNTLTVETNWIYAAASNEYDYAVKEPRLVTTLYAQWGETLEQFNLKVGETYYFDLSAVKTDLDKIDGITYHAKLPNTSLVLLPFTYVGTITAYDLGSSAKITAAAADAQATPRSLFVSDYNIAKATWSELHGQGLIYNKDYMDGAMRLRAMTGGVVEFFDGSYTTFSTKNEWEQILGKTKPAGMTGDWIKNQFPVATPQEAIWCQDPEPDSTLYRAVRGMRDDSWIQSWLPNEKSFASWWRPVIEVLNPATLGENGLPAVTFDLNGGTFDGGKTEFKIICMGDSYQVPGRYLKDFTNPTGVTVTTFFYNTERDGSGINYKVGSTVPNTVKTLYAQYNGDKATILTTALPEGTVGVEYDFNLEATGPEPIEWSLSSTNYKLPKGLQLKSNRIFGTPTVEGEKILKFLVANPVGSTFSEEFIIKINANPDAEAVAAAIQAAENATYANTTQTANGTQTAVENYVKDIASTAVNNANITVIINPVTYTAPIDGTSSDLDGTEGSYTFTVTVSKGSQEMSTTEKTVTITATEFTDISDADAVAAAMAAVVNGSVEVASDADQTAITAAVQAYVNGLLTGDASGVSAVVTFINGNTYNVAFTKGTASDSADRTFEITIEKEDECFIATAAFGSKFDWPVTLLRHFRDQYMLTNPLGTAFVNFYYQNSPPIAATIASSQPLKILVRLLLAPVIAGVYLIYHPVILVAALFLLTAFFAVRRLSLSRRYIQLKQLDVTIGTESNANY